MQKFLFVLHLPEKSSVDDDGKDNEQTFWSEFEPRIKTSGLPIEVSSKPLEKSQRIARNIWLIPTEELVHSSSAIQQIAAKFHVEFSAYSVSGDIALMKTKP